MSLHLDPDRIPVYSSYGCIMEKATAQRVRQLLAAPNAEPVIRQKDNRLMRIILYPFGENFRTRSRQRGRKFSHNHETSDNPERVWTHARGIARAAHA